MTAPETSVRAASPADAPALAAIHATGFAEPWSAESFEKLMAMPGAYALVNEAETGFILMRAAGGEAEILTIAVAPEARRRGLARGLLAAGAAVALASGAARIFLEVAEDNAPARAFYAGAGFSETGRRRGYYTSGRGTPADALVLSMEMAESGA